jgi:hypothetical protein
MSERKPILCLDFDGVIHSYATGWTGADHIHDKPVDGAMKFLTDAVEHFDVHIYSSRSNQAGGIRAMKKWVERELFAYWGAHATVADDTFAALKWPKEKPPALVTIDDRAICFDGTWPSLETLKGFKPWNKR